MINLKADENRIGIDKKVVYSCLVFLNMLSRGLSNLFKKIHINLEGRLAVLELELKLESEK